MVTGSGQDRIYGHYNRELAYLRKLAAEFAERHPAVAGSLLLEPQQSQDPHVERLIQSAAFLAARIQLRLDDDYPELADSLLSILYPHYLAPLPAATLVQFDLDMQQGKVATGTTIDRHTTLLSKTRVGDIACKFRTVYPVQLWPIVLERAELVPVTRAETLVLPGARAALRLAFRTHGGEPVAEYALSALRLCLVGEHRHALYEALFREPLGMIVRTGREGGVALPAANLWPVGFERDEGLYDYPPTAALGYRLLQEYFAFADKFLFAELRGLQVLKKAGTAAAFEVLVLLPELPTELENRVSERDFRLGCTPAVNLFPIEAEPIRMDHREVEYRVTPNHRALANFEVHSVVEVLSTQPGKPGHRAFRPFFAVRHGDTREAVHGYWHARREPSQRRNKDSRGSEAELDHGTDVWLTLVDEQFAPALVETDEVVHVGTLCTNRDIPDSIVFGNPQGDFLLEGVPEIVACRALGQPTRTLRPHLHGQSRWRLVSHLALNHLSLTGGAGDSALRAFRELLRLYDFGETAVTRRRIEGLVGLQSARVTRLIRGIGPVRGIGVELTFDPAAFDGSSPYLFASVLERFLGLYATINSFTETTMRLRQRDAVHKRWLPRAGEQALP
ncbi:MAG: type VI secretion system baseplate subunit TssF [Planctomycetota bacterium]